jgi:hypothetical protein
VQKKNRSAYKLPPQTVIDNLITIYDRFEDRVLITFKAAFLPGTTSADISLTYDDTNFEWQETLKSGDTIKCNVPTLKKMTPTEKKKFTVTCDIESDSGKSLTLEAKGASINQVKI